MKSHRPILPISTLFDTGFQTQTAAFHTTNITHLFVLFPVASSVAHACTPLCNQTYASTASVWPAHSERCLSTCIDFNRGNRPDMPIFLGHQRSRRAEEIQASLGDKSLPLIELRKLDSSKQTATNASRKIYLTKTKHI